MNIQEVKFDCKYFRGSIPCLPNKQDGSQCNNCNHYEAFQHNILIIKLGAIGDVIRTTPLLSKIRKEYPKSKITWITWFPDVLPKDEVDEILLWDATNLFKLLDRKFDWAINLDKEEEACQLLAKVNSKEKRGFIWQNDHLAAASPAAEHKILTGLFDELSQSNTKNYLEEIFEIAHWNFEGETYSIRTNSVLVEQWKSKFSRFSNGKKLIGLNTGCGPRWKTRLWDVANWIELAKNLNQMGYAVVLLGGPGEDEKNKSIAQEVDVFYEGHYSLEEFIALCNALDGVVSQVSLMMHIAVALQIPMVLMNNIFNANEFELYGRGKTVEPSSSCDCYYGGSCTRNRPCMKDISVETIVTNLQSLV